MAIARPSLPAANYSLRWWEWLGIITSAGLSVAGYFGLIRRQEQRRLPEAGQLQHRNRLKVWCLLTGLLLLVLLTGIPWSVRVRAELLSPGNEGTEDIPVAAVFLIDNSISMKYRQENLTRLEAAAERS